MLFLGKDVDYWMRIQEFYEEVQPVINTEEGKRLVLLGRIRRLQQSIEKDTATIKKLQHRLQK